MNSFDGHQDTVRAVCLDADLVASGADDASIRIWSRQANRCSQLLGHTGKIQCLQFDSNKLVSGATDSTIKIWNLATKACLQTLTTPPDAGWVRCLEYSERILITGSTRKFMTHVSGHGDNQVRVWKFGQSKN